MKFYYLFKVGDKMLLGAFLYGTLLCLAALNLKLKNNAIRYFILIALFLIAALRYDVGIDYISYLTAAETSQLARFGIVYDVIYFIQELIKFDYLFFVVTSGLFALMLKKLIKLNFEYKNEIIFFIIFGAFYFLSFNLVRQSLAMMAGFIALTFYIKDNDDKNFYKFIFIAFLFHPTALILILVPFLKKIFKRLSNNLLLIIYVFVFITGPLIFYLFSLASYILPLTEYSRNYILNVDFSYTMGMVANFGLIVVILLFFSKILKDKKVKEIFLLMYMGMIMKNFIPGNSGRIIMYLTDVYILFFSYIWTKNNKDLYLSVNSYKLMKLVFFGFCLIKLVSFIVLDSGGVFPYQTWLFGI